MHEVFPLAAGLVVGVALALIAPRLRFWVGAAAAVVLGVAATVVSGEYRIGWEFLLIDVPLVAVAALFGLAAARAARARVAPPR